MSYEPVTLAMPVDLVMGSFVCMYPDTPVTLACAIQLWQPMLCRMNQFTLAMPVDLVMGLILFCVHVP